MKLQQEGAEIFVPDGLPVEDVAKVDARAELARLGLNDHLSAQRSNGLRAMIERIRKISLEAV